MTRCARKLFAPLLLAIFLIGTMSANPANAQVPNVVYWIGDDPSMWWYGSTLPYYTDYSIVEGLIPTYGICSSYDSSYTCKTTVTYDDKWIDTPCSVCWPRHWVDWYVDYVKVSTRHVTVSSDVFYNGTFLPGASQIRNMWISRAIKNCPLGQTIDLTVGTATSGQCIQAETYTVTLTPDRPTTEPSTPLGFTVTVLNQNNQAPKSPVTVHLALKVDPASGGHDHGDSTRPRGGLNDTACTSDAPCIDVSTSDADTSKAGFTFKPTDASGTHTITPSCDRCSGSPVNVDVKVDGLKPITAKPWLYALIGGEADKQHHDNHYLNDNAFKQLVVLAINYHFLYPNDPILHLNDASLVWGGKFDIQGTWVGDHKGHKKGTVIDIRANSINETTNSNPGSSIPERLFADFEKLAANTKLNGTGKSVKAKLHCSRGRDPSVDNCVGDINRHYHVILLGVDQ